MPSWFVFVSSSFRFCLRSALVSIPCTLAIRSICVFDSLPVSVRFVFEFGSFRFRGSCMLFSFSFRFRFEFDSSSFRFRSFSNRFYSFSFFCVVVVSFRLVFEFSSLSVPCRFVFAFVSCSSSFDPFSF